jgi:hypothetical protein
VTLLEQNGEAIFRRCHPEISILEQVLEYIDTHEHQESVLWINSQSLTHRKMILLMLHGMDEELVETIIWRVRRRRLTLAQKWMAEVKTALFKGKK